MKNNSLLYAPVVFAAGNSYENAVRVKKPAMIRVIVGERSFFDHSNGICVSDTPVHKIRVPAEELNKVDKYTVAVRTLIKRKPYFSNSHDEEFESFPFFPVPDDGDVTVCHIADVHGFTQLALDTADRLTQKPDLLVLNGDVIDSSNDVRYFDTIYEICDKLTGGKIPVVFSRGNHDLRGNCAEKLADYVAAPDGKSYFSVRLGSLWCLVLDTGEDKADDHPEYGNTVCCEFFRREETEFIKRVIAEKSYEAPGIRHRVIICHNPFTIRYPEPFNIEPELFSQWAKLIGEGIRPDLMLCGHLHKTGVLKPGGEHDELGQPCDILLGSDMKKGKSVTLAQITFNDSGYDYSFISNQ